MKLIQRRQLTSLGLAATVALTLAACSDGSSNQPTPIFTTPTTPTTPTGPTSPAPAPAPAPVPIPAPIATTKVTFMGRVVDEPIANAQVVAVCGGTTVRTTADAQGNYTLPLEVPSADAALPVLVTATGIGPQASVTLVSLPGTVNALVADAGADAVLTASENIRANVTHVSTAEAVLVMELAGGSVPATQMAQDDFAKRVDPNLLFDLAAAIKLIIDTPRDLPPGVADTLSFAQNVSARTAYIADIRENAPAELEQAKLDTASSPDAVMQMTASSVPAQIYVTAIPNDFRIASNFLSNLEAFTFNPSGTGTNYTASSFSTNTWLLQNNQLVVTFDEPAMSINFPTVDTNGDGVPDTQVQENNSTASATLTLLSERLVVISQTFRRVYPNREVPDRTETFTGSAMVINPAADAAPFLASNFAATGGRLLTSTYLPMDEASGRLQFSGDILTFSQGGAGTAQITQQGFNWSAPATGELVLAMPGNVSVRYSGLNIEFANQDPQNRLVFVEVTTPTAKYADIVQVVAQSTPLVFTNASVPGEYFLSGLGELDFRGGFTTLNLAVEGFSIQYGADGFSFQSEDFIDANGNRSRATPESAPNGIGRWTLSQNGVLTSRRSFDNSLPEAQSRRCNPDTSPSCTTFDSREMFPFAVTGGRHYWVERRRLDFNGLTASTPATLTLRYWDKE